ncbi:MAG: hypothetical protein R3B93_26120 [Bacteroidia bacterium]
MLELTQKQYLQTMESPMRQFQLTSGERKETIFEIAGDILTEKNIPYTRLELSFCYENNTATYSHYLVNWGAEDQYIAIISDDVNEKWYGFRLLDMKTEYSIRQ